MRMQILYTISYSKLSGKGSSRCSCIMEEVHSTGNKLVWGGKPNTGYQRKLRKKATSVSSKVIVFYRQNV